MYSIRGARNSAWITGSIIDDTTIKQLYNMLASPAITGRVVIMPDTHAGAMMGDIVSSVNPVDECDAVYKPPEVIIEEIAETVQAEFIIRPVLNIKGGQE